MHISTSCPYSKQISLSGNVSGEDIMPHPSLRDRLATCCWLALFAVTIFTTSPGWAVAAPRTFEIGAGSAAVTLREFGRQAELQTLFDYKLAQGRTTQAVLGNFEPEEALTRMLAGTGLTFERVDERTVAIRSATAADPSAGKSTGAAARRRQMQEGAASEGGDRLIIEEIIVTA
ncbi:MAG: STN domain-containing protein, partial [Steroidobacteraceae bacterium]